MSESLIVQTGELEELTTRREGDAVTALVVALAEHLRTLRRVDYGGRPIAFAAVEEFHAEPDRDATLPAACVTQPSEASYESSNMQGRMERSEDLKPTQRILKRGSVDVQLSIAIWASDAKQRSALVGLVEQGLNPYEERTGLRLRMPHYHGLHASYAMMGVHHQDSALEARQRRKVAVFRVKASCNVVRVFERAEGHAQVRVEVSEAG